MQVMDSNRKRSGIWRYFSQVSNDRAKCQFCGQKYSFSGGISNLSRHIKLKHPSIELGSGPKRACPLVDDSNDLLLPEVSASTTSEVSLVTLQSSVATDSLLPEASTSTTSDIGQIPSQSSSTMVNPQVNPSGTITQMTLSRFIHRPLGVKASQRIDEGLLKLIISQYLPFSLVEQPTFRAFVRQLNSNYHLPSRKTLANNYLELLYSKTADDLRRKLKEPTACSITVDGWTSANNDSYLAVTAHFISNGELQSALLDCACFQANHTAFSISEEVLNIVKNWGLEGKVVAIISDNAANMLSAARYLGWKHIPCFAHILNLIVQNSLTEVRDLQTRVKSIVEYFKRSSSANLKLKKFQGQGNYPTLKQEVPTRWNSTFLMFQSVIKNKEPLLAALALADCKVTLHTTDFTVMEQICKLLTPFYEVTKEISSEKQVTASKIIPFCLGIRKYFEAVLAEKEGLNDEVQQILGKINSEMEKRFNKIEENSIIAEATLLDPRFKKVGFDDVVAAEKTKKNLIAKAAAHNMQDHEETQHQGTIQQEEDSTESPSSGSVWKHFDSMVKTRICLPSPTAAAIIEMDKFLAEPHLERHGDPLKWWWRNRDIYPRFFNKQSYLHKFPFSLQHL
jgi:hypothetical protein